MAGQRIIDYSVKPRSIRYAPDPELLPILRKSVMNGGEFDLEREFEKVFRAIRTLHRFKVSERAFLDAYRASGSLSEMASHREVRMRPDRCLMVLKLFGFPIKNKRGHLKGVPSAARKATNLQIRRAKALGLSAHETGDVFDMTRQAVEYRLRRMKLEPNKLENTARHRLDLSWTTLMYIETVLRPTH